MNYFLDDYGFKIPEIPGYPSGYTFCPEYQAVYDAFDVKPDDDIAVQQDIMVRALVSAGIWAKLDLFYIFANNTAANAVINWVNPGTFDCLEVNAPAFTVNRGYTGNGVNAYLNTQWNPLTDAINFVQDSAAFGCYNRTTDVTDNKVLMGCRDGVARCILNVRALTWQSRINTSNVGLGPAHTGSIDGFLIVTREGANSQTLYRNSVSLQNNASASTGRPNGPLYILCENRIGIFDDAHTLNQLAMSFASSHITGVPESTLFQNAIETYFDYIGAGVIP